MSSMNAVLEKIDSMSVSGTSSQPPPPNPVLVLFARGVIARLTLWPALRLAIEQSWGGPESLQKRTWMASVIVDAFDTTQNPQTPDVYYIEETLLQIMEDEFDAAMEDGSPEQVARDVVYLWNNIREPRGEQRVREWEEQAQKLRGSKVPFHAEASADGESEEDEDVSEDEDDNEAPQLLESGEETKKSEPEVDEDGFTLVKSKGKRHK